MFDFTLLNGAFGKINAAGETAVSFLGTGGMGAKCRTLSGNGGGHPRYYPLIIAVSVINALLSIWVMQVIA